MHRENGNSFFSDTDMPQFGSAQLAAGRKFFHTDCNRYFALFRQSDMNKFVSA